MNPKNNIKSFFKSNWPLNTEGMEELLAAFESKVYPKHSLILQLGQQEHKIRFLNQGFIREFYTNDAKENNINFYVKPTFINQKKTFLI